MDKYERLTECRHFNGIQHDRCKAGVQYRSVCDLKVQSLPCHEKPFLNRPFATCEQCSYLTPEELIAREAELKTQIAEFLEKEAAGICPHCGRNANPMRIIGRCKYTACGHRLGQVSTDYDEP